jgi:hypothetical protein
VVQEGVEVEVVLLNLPMLGVLQEEEEAEVRLVNVYSRM